MTRLTSVAFALILTASALLYGTTAAQAEQRKTASVEKDFRFIESADNLREPKILGGRLVPSGQFGGIVGLSARNNGDLNCTGTLIEPDVVVSAAHCICDGFDRFVMIGNEEKRGQYIKVLGKSHGLRSCGGSLTNGRDIAVLVLANTADVQAVGIAPASLIDSAASYRVVGFGFDENNRIGTKRETAVPRASNDCNGVVPGSNRTDASTYGCLPKQEIVAGKPGLGRDTCNGDSGGPLLVSPNATGFGTRESFLLAGLTSRPTRNSARRCGDGGIYVRLNNEARAWIAGKVDEIRRRSGR